MQIVISNKNGQLEIRSDHDPITQLNNVTNKFFMYRVGEGAKSHMVNLFIENRDDDDEIQRIKLEYNKEVNFLNKN